MLTRTPKKAVIFREVSAMNPGLFSLTWNNHLSILSVFEKLLDSNSLVDCTLTSEGQYIKAHKVVLSASSPYFELLFSVENEKHPIIFFKDLKFETLKAIIDFIYRGKVNIPENKLRDFLEASESLQINGIGNPRTSFGNLGKRVSSDTELSQEKEGRSSPVHKKRHKSDDTNNSETKVENDIDTKDNIPILQDLSGINPGIPPLSVPVDVPSSSNSSHSEPGKGNDNSDKFAGNTNVNSVLSITPTIADVSNQVLMPNLFDVPPTSTQYLYVKQENEIESAAPDYQKQANDLPRSNENIEDKLGSDNAISITEGSQSMPVPALVDVPFPSSPVYYVKDTPQGKALVPLSIPQKQKRNENTDKSKGNLVYASDRAISLTDISQSMCTPVVNIPSSYSVSKYQIQTNNKEDVSENNKAINVTECSKKVRMAASLEIPFSSVTIHQTLAEKYEDNSLHQNMLLDVTGSKDTTSVTDGSQSMTEPVITHVPTSILPSLAVKTFPSTSQGPNVIEKPVKSKELAIESVLSPCNSPVPEFLSDEEIDIKHEPITEVILPSLDFASEDDSNSLDNNELPSESLADRSVDVMEKLDYQNKTKESTKDKSRKSSKSSKKLNESSKTTQLPKSSFPLDSSKKKESTVHVVTQLLRPQGDSPIPKMLPVAVPVVSTEQISTPPAASKPVISSPATPSASSSATPIPMVSSAPASAVPIHLVSVTSYGIPTPVVTTLTKSTSQNSNFPAAASITTPMPNPEVCSTLSPTTLTQTKCAISTPTVPQISNKCIPTSPSVPGTSTVKTPSFPEKSIHTEPPILITSTPTALSNPITSIALSAQIISTPVAPSLGEVSSSLQAALSPPAVIPTTSSSSVPTRPPTLRSVGLFRHRSNASGLRQDLICPDCSQSFLSSTLLDLHRARNHNLKCQHCDIGCRDWSHHHTQQCGHLCQSQSEKSFACPMCQKTFARRSDLLIHCRLICLSRPAAHK